MTSQGYFPGPPLPREVERELLKPVKIDLLDHLELLAAQHRAWSPDLAELVGIEKAQEIVTGAYFWARYPLRRHSIDDWIDRFKQLGIEAGDGTYPDREVTLFRGADFDSPHGLSWSPYFQIAAAYARQRENGAVWGMRANWSEVLRHRCVSGHPHLPYEVIIDSRPHELELMSDMKHFNSSHHDTGKENQ